MKTLLLLLVIVAVVVSSCGKDDSKSTGSTGKNLFSAWAETQPSASMVLDMTSMGFGTNALGLSLTAGGYCACTLTIGGTQSSGNYALTSCSFNANGTSNTDPGCASFDGSNTYTNDGTTLTLCKAGTTSCSTWK